ncbi:MAG TPA: ThiF family adenylyltransferase [Candidatus Margulisiibacteriota bacterium]|nr:ThiF family adenylyltransferase [Candidatus Margulisiibacteriota bacterium]
MLSEQQIERYSRQIILPELGGRGQEALLSARVAVVGGGMLGTMALTYLAAAGVRRLLVAAPQLADIEGLNPDCQTTTLPAPLTEVSALEAARHCDAVLACGAAPEVCALLNAACVAQHIPLVWADTAGARGLISVLAGPHLESPCYTCVAPLLGRLLAGGSSHAFADTTAALIGTLQATETIKILAGLSTPPMARLLTYDAAAGTADVMSVDRDPRCPTCGARPG